MHKKITRRAFCSMLLALPFPAWAQQPAKIPRLGFLPGGSPSSAAPFTKAFRQGLRELGYVEGKNIVIEYRYTEGKLDRLPALLADLVRLKVDIIVVGGGASVLAAKNATKTIPIVMTVVGDPVGTGVVASLAQPGGNITGLSILSPELSGKRLELLKEIVPGRTRVAVFANPSSPSLALMLRETQEAARFLGLQLQIIEVRPESSSGLESAFQTATKGRAGALSVLASQGFVTERKKLVELAAKNRMTAIYDDREIVESGGLVSYGPDRADLYRRAATYVDKILKGRTPADLPVEQPMKFEFVINLIAAKQIGLTIPPNVLVRADKVIR
jgi:putative ABC transport system substrate-binding protein